MVLLDYLANNYLGCLDVLFGGGQRAGIAHRLSGVENETGINALKTLVYSNRLIAIIYTEYILYTKFNSLTAPSCCIWTPYNCYQPGESPGT